MKHNQLLKRILIWICLGVCLCVQSVSSAFSYNPSTLHNGSRGKEVRELQEALIELGFLKGKADGIFGNKTEKAVRSFQKKYNLKADGLAGDKTRSLIRQKAEEKRKRQETPTPVPTSVPTPTPKPTDSGTLFGGNFTTIRYGNTGDRVAALQEGLIRLGFLKGKADGNFGKKTLTGVKKFQKSLKLTADGVAGKKTLKALEKEWKKARPTESPSPAPTPSPTPEPTSEPAPVPDTEDEDLNAPIEAPPVSSLQLLHWFNDVKPSLSNKQQLLIYDPVTGLSWTLQILARGRHCDAEPLTAKDTRTMVKAFGGGNTWNQKAVYVRLPDGRWTIGSTHDMPHMSGNIKDNDFNGHLCVHFLRNMEEAKQNDPNYGVSNQETIRTWWKKWTGEDITV